MTPTQPKRRTHASAGLALLSLIGGCTTLPWQMTPEDRSLQQPPQQAASPASTDRAARRPPVNADKPLSDGYYRVKPGDTLYRIATSHGQRSEDIIKWNNLTDPGHIETGGVLRVTPPSDAASGSDASASSAQAKQQRTSAPAKPDDAAKANPKSDKADSTDKKDDKSTETGKPGFVWPARGTLSEVYGQGKSKGIVIAARAGDPVKAATSGRVVFAGDGGKPYGKLIVTKHDDTLVTAYGHNRKLLVKEGTSVKRGETIAEMAATDHGNGSMQFEVRKDGKPINPAMYLPRVGS
ncbi:UNVERIFIED_ORG: lipoprotein NlpD [Burkholderia sp. CF145]|uniref:M23 family metallopeptidase n=1 Tax=Paraburkholderia hospita TaxID=169430 RepID=UPI000271AECA|nr:M23 family metallopeptidase [Paraburkholderia hospita]EUC18946.1 Peptidase M23 [Burkholderia sp. BT03]SKC65964.1 Murein DD-endopeptidase MepM and murein hydrolase activator NlpD, contain LysM domain [Paraburkholderia hospita]